MSPAEAKRISGRSESWLRNHQCAWCGQTLWLALRNGCGAIFDRCEPAEKDFSAGGRTSADLGSERPPTHGTTP